MLHTFAVLSLIFAVSQCRDIVNLDVPMVHQRWDVPHWYDGSWGCGPTSAIMSIAFHKRLPAKPHQNNYGYYLPNIYSIVHHGKTITYNKMDRDAAHNPAWGAFGSCTVNGGGRSDMINTFIQQHNLTTNYTASGVTWQTVKAALDRKNPVVLDTRLTSAGHIILIRGYDSDGNMIVNDPYGNAHASGYGHYTNGKEVRYTFDFTKAAGHWMIEVHGKA